MNQTKMQNSNLPTVLVTGATGFLAGYVIQELLSNPYLKVKATVRSISKKERYEHLFTNNPSSKQKLEIVEVDLEDISSVESAFTNVEYVVHIASVTPSRESKQTFDYYKPNITMTENVFNTAIKSGIRKFVYISCYTTIVSGKEETLGLFDEDHWGSEANAPYHAQSKILAEKLIWEQIEQNKNLINCTILIPGLILGPLQNEYVSSSVDVIYRFLADDYPGIPKVSWPVVDVRDVAHSVLLALREGPSGCSGERVILANQTYWYRDIANIIKEQYNFKVPIDDLDAFAMKMFSLWDQQAKAIKTEVGKKYNLVNQKSREELGTVYRPIEETVIATVESLINFGLVKDKRKSPEEFEAVVQKEEVSEEPQEEVEEEKEQDQNENSVWKKLKFWEKDENSHEDAEGKQTEEPKSEEEPSKMEKVLGFVKRGFKSEAPKGDMEYSFKNIGETTVYPELEQKQFFDAAAPEPNTLDKVMGFFKKNVSTETSNQHKAESEAEESKERPEGPKTDEGEGSKVDKLFGFVKKKIAGISSQPEPNKDQNESAIPELKVEEKKSIWKIFK